MVSHMKRTRFYPSENDYSSSEENSEDADYMQQTDKKNSNPTPRQSSKTKWLSKNAIMARENRLKKKMYINNLESEVNRLKTDNNKFVKVIENQSTLITDLKKEIKYLKSVIANSSDIGKLVRAVHQSTGMSVATSLEHSISLNNDYVSKPKLPIARKTAHPWEEKNYPSYPTPESDFASCSRSETDLNEETNCNYLFDDLKLDAFLGVSDSLLDIADLNDSNGQYMDDDQLHLKEHNYVSVDENKDVGVCLHVSKKRVSIEFCSSCSDNAAHTWMD